MSHSYEYVGSELEVFAGAHRWKAYLKRQFEPFVGGDVCEVGAGIGSTTRALIDGTERSWTCLEPDGSLARQLKQSLDSDDSKHVRDAKIIVGTIGELPEATCFDAILYVDVIEHIEDDRGELQRAAEHLRPGGHLIVLAPAHQWLYSPFDKAIGHYRRYSRARLLSTGPASLQLVRGRYLDSVGVLASMANRLLLKSRDPTTSQIAVWDRYMVRVSRIVDPFLKFRLGKSVLAVWRRP